MADLVTHMATALIWKGATRQGHLATLLMGVVLPDLSGRVPTMALARVEKLGVPVSQELIHAFGVLHMPLGMLAMTMALALLFREDQRLAAWANLFGGCMLHLATDLLQSHTGVGYPLLYPFSTWHWEAGLLGSEATVPWSLPLLLLGLGLWWWRRPPASQPAEGPQ